MIKTKHMKIHYMKYVKNDQLVLKIGSPENDRSFEKALTYNKVQ